LNIKKSEIDGVWSLSFLNHSDSRGNFREWFKSSIANEAAGKEIFFKQANYSKSKLNVIRGIHFTINSEPEFKLVSCISGAILDVAVDLRIDSPTFGASSYYKLSEENGNSLLISDGIGHAFLSLSENAVISYLVTSEYDSKLEVSVNPFDPELNIDWGGDQFIVSDKDRYSQSFSDYRATGM